MGISPQRVREMQRAGYFNKMAKLVDPGRRNYKWWDNAAFAKFRKEFRERREDRGKPKPKATSVYRMSRRRQEKIERLREIVEIQMEVSAEDKHDALLYYDGLSALADSMVNLYIDRWWIGPWKMNPARRIPLLEGIHALFEAKFVFGYGEVDAIVDLKKEIERLPTRSKTTPQTE
jgi:hypothetical protein